MKKEERKQKKGISLIALIITIIVIVLLAAIVVNTAITTPQSASFAKFVNNMGELQQAVALSYYDIYTTEAVKTPRRTDAQIYEEIAKGAGDTPTQYPSALPAGIDGNTAWKVNDVSKLSSVENLPEGDFYITDKGVIFSASGYNNNGEIFLTASVKVDRVLNLPEGLIANGSWDNVKGVNTPKLVTGMIPIYFDNNGNEIEVTSSEDEWYDYNRAENVKWANAKSENSDGVTTAYWVWIPRYAYQIGDGTTINVQFLKGTTDTCTDDTTAIRSSNTKSSENGNKYVVHPAFTSNISLGGWDKELSGIWVAKFMAGYAMDRNGDGDSDVTNGNTVKPVASSVEYTQTMIYAPAEETGTGSNGDVLARNWLDGVYGSTITKIKYPVFLPQTIAMNYINHNDSYEICRALETSGNIYGFNSSSNTHLMKNSEWGAVAYLTRSDRGNTAEITINSANLNNNEPSAYGVTGNGNIGTISNITANAWVSNTASSSTGNVSGIYDLSGCLWERVASYVANGHYNLVFGDSFTSVVSSTKYATAYKSYENNPGDRNNAGIQNYDGLKADTSYEMYGDATIENSTAGIGANGWYSDYSAFPGLGNVFFTRGGIYSNSLDGGAGAFSFTAYDGASGYYSGFRAVVCQ